jgi:hypothetical protein
MAEEKKEIKANFLQFIYGMANQTMVQLGLSPNPITGGTEVNLVQAQYSIELLEIIREKTEGNLTEEEQEYFDKALAQLKVALVDIQSKN